MQRASIFAFVALCCLAVCSAVAAEPDPKPAPGLDERLLEDLADDIPATDKAPATADKKAAPGVDRQLMQDLTDGEDIGEKPENPLQSIAERMKQAQQRIAGSDTSGETQRLQSDISQRLAKLIEQVQKQNQAGAGQQRSGGRGKGGAQPGPEGGNPMPGAASESTQRVEQAPALEKETVDVKDMLRRVWGHLPEKAREQMQNSIDEEFLPKYEKLIEQYYQRLAEQPSAGT